MLARRLGEEFGYSLVEVMASIVILTMAIIPMVGMFDMGLTTATRGGNYDKARTLANLKLEQAKSMSFDTVKYNFPVTSSTPDPTSGYYQSGWLTEPGADFANFGYRIEKQYMARPTAAPPAASESFATSNTDVGLIRVTVTVRWPDGNTYTTFGLVTR